MAYVIHNNIRFKKSYKKITLGSRDNIQAITVSVNKNSGRRLIRNTGKIVENGGKLWRDVRGVCAMKR